MRIGSQEWYDVHPDAPDASDLAEEREWERKNNYRPGKPTGAWAEALEKSRQNAMKASRED